MKVDILGKSYKVVHTDDENILEGREGELRFREQVIYVRKALHPQTAQETLLHEIIHGLDFQMDLGLDESQVERLANGLRAVLTKNKNVV